MLTANCQMLYDSAHSASSTTRKFMTHNNLTLIVP